jgi:endoglucanase
MRKAMRGVAIIAFVMSVFQPAFTATPWLHVEGNQIKDPLGNKVVLHGVSLQAISNVNASMVMDLVTNTNDKASKSPGWYTRIVRFPVLSGSGNWTQYNQNTLKPAIDYATKKGLYAIIDLHYVAETGPNVAATNSFWTTIAPLYKDYSNVIFEPYNEPINTSQSWSQFKPTMQAWVDLIRSYAPNNLIFVGSPTWCQKMGDAATDSIKGKNIVYVVHMYPSHWATQWNKDEVTKCAAARAMVCTEWGFKAGLNWGPNETVSGYGTGILTWFAKLGISWTAWCADISWDPTMFNSGNPWTLRVGEGEMGGFVKDWLYTYRDSCQPSAATSINSEYSVKKRATDIRSIVIREHGNTLNLMMPQRNQYTAQIIGPNGIIFEKRYCNGNSLSLNTSSLKKGLYIVKVAGNSSIFNEHFAWMNN